MSKTRLITQEHLYYSKYRADRTAHSFQAMATSASTHVHLCLKISGTVRAACNPCYGAQVESLPEDLLLHAIATGYYVLVLRSSELMKGVTTVAFDYAITRHTKMKLILNCTAIVFYDLSMLRLAYCKFFDICRFFFGGGGAPLHNIMSSLNACYQHTCVELALVATKSFMD